MLPALCLNKVYIVIVIVIVIMGTCIQFSNQQRRQSGFPMYQFENSKIDSRNRNLMNAGKQHVFSTTTFKPVKESKSFKYGRGTVFATTTYRPAKDSIAYKSEQKRTFATTTSKPSKDYYAYKYDKKIAFVANNDSTAIKSSQKIVFPITTSRPALKPAQELVFVTTTSKPAKDSIGLKFGQTFVSTTSKPARDSHVLQPGQELIFITTTSKSLKASPLDKTVVFINNQPKVATMVPFIPSATTPTSEFAHCFMKCPTTSEFNPICASNRQVYGNEQKFNCAKQCGADIEIVRYGNCEGLFPMVRG